jgi:hypothetical protein
MFCMLLFNFVNYLILLLCYIFLFLCYVFLLLRYVFVCKLKYYCCYVCSVLCILIHCVVLSIVFLCVLYYCHRVSTQLQLNIYHIKISSAYCLGFPRERVGRLFSFQMSPREQRVQQACCSLLYRYGAMCIALCHSL